MALTKHLYNNPKSLARDVLLQLMQFSRKSCTDSSCELCLEPHLQQVMAAIAAFKPIQFVLPAFPGKSPNLEKVLGIDPDMAERCSLIFLHNLCKRIKRIYSPGANIILCSDGRVFNDIVGMKDLAVSQYQKGLARLIREMSLDWITMFNLDQVYPHLNYIQMREILLTEYGESLSELKKSVIEDPETNRLYCGITRFLLEDATHKDQSLSRTALQKICRLRAYSVVLRSRAWSNLIRKYFPESVRLSIHPQYCGSSKLGIRLMKSSIWMTPWHGVAVEVAGRYVLLKRKQAEKLGAQLIFHEGKPSHFKITDEYADEL